MCVSPSLFSCRCQCLVVGCAALVVQLRLVCCQFEQQCHALCYHFQLPSVGAFLVGECLPQSAQRTDIDGNSMIFAVEPPVLLHTSGLWCVVMYGRQSIQ